MTGKTEKKITPMMQQWMDIKEEHPDMIILFRLGDFYEMFYDDAVQASAILQIALTKRHESPMCGIPHHALNNYLFKITTAGKKVAIVEQVEEPEKGKAIVKRAVTQIITPGTVTNPDSLEIKSNNFLCSFQTSQADKNGVYELAFAALDISTGDIEVILRSVKYINIELENLLVTYSPKEILMPDSVENEQDYFFRPNEYLLNKLPGYIFQPQYAEGKIRAFYNINNTANNGLTDTAVGTLWSLLHYAKETQKGDIAHIKLPRILTKSSHMQLDSMTLKNLELIKNNYNSTKENTLLSSIDETITPMGGRKLIAWILKPLIEKKDILLRLDTIDFISGKPSALNDIRAKLKNIHDIERLTTRLAMGKITPKELKTLEKSLNAYTECTAEIKSLKLPAKEYNTYPDMSELYKIINSTLLDEPSNQLTDGGYINPETDKTLKKYLQAKNEGNQWLLDTLEQEKKKTGISNLKIKFNENTGYYFDVTKAQTKNVPEYFIRKATMVNSERFTTEELLKLQEKILEARDNANKLEQTLYKKLLETLSADIYLFQEAAEYIAVIDTLCAFAYNALHKNFNRPSLSTDSTLDITDGRHPVVEQSITNPFIPNSLSMDTKSGILHIITGPNMSGKSTFLRQNALIVLLTHIGSFVPAAKAEIPICDRIFTRIGASDNLSRGESTFLVEMNETANILANATEKSLVIMDEIGRGTSTYDGLSLAWAILEYINNEKSLQCKTLFATHYHELTVLEADYPHIKNYHFTIHEEHGKLTFLKKIIAGPSDKSYGIHVAELAGLPKKILTEAWRIQAELEKNSIKSESVKTGKKANKKQVHDFSIIESALIRLTDEIKSFDVNSSSPLEALTFLKELQESISD
jgi:DNA mismatch repair protein MutS